jgi:4-diphosphocytidyl-2-C-methyl-D-erythritol kinase
VAAVVEFAPAKINLDLRVLGRRPDGYHELDSVVVFAALTDHLRVASDAGLGLELVGPEAGPLRALPDNLVLRAARLMAEAAGRRPDVRIRLEKRIPVAAGLGGGSADAAALLRALDRLWHLGLGYRRLVALALRLGADVPACLRSRPVRMRGIGERLEPLAGLDPFHLVLANPRVPTPTAQVFEALEAPPLEAGAPSAGGAPERRWLEAGANDLERPAVALVPVIGTVLETLRTLPQVRLVRMTGSGATCFALFDHWTASERAAARLLELRPGWWVQAVATMPAP